MQKNNNLCIKIFENIFIHEKCNYWLYIISFEQWDKICHAIKNNKITYISAYSIRNILKNDIILFFLRNKSRNEKYIGNEKYKKYGGSFIAIAQTASNMKKNTNNITIFNDNNLNKNIIKLSSIVIYNPIKLTDFKKEIKIKKNDPFTKNFLIGDCVFKKIEPKKIVVDIIQKIYDLTLINSDSNNIIFDNNFSNENKINHHNKNYKLDDHDLDKYEFDNNDNANENNDDLDEDYKKSDNSDIIEDYKSNDSDVNDDYNNHANKNLDNNNANEDRESDNHSDTRSNKDNLNEYYKSNNSDVNDDYNNNANEDCESNNDDLNEDYKSSDKKSDNGDVIEDYKTNDSDVNDSDVNDSDVNDSDVNDSDVNDEYESDNNDLNENSNSNREPNGNEIKTIVSNIPILLLSCVQLIRELKNTKNKENKINSIIKHYKYCNNCDITNNNSRELNQTLDLIDKKNIIFEENNYKKSLDAYFHLSNYPNKGNLKNDHVKIYHLINDDIYKNDILIEYTSRIYM